MQNIAFIMSMGVVEYDSENENYGNSGVVEEQVDWPLDSQAQEKVIMFHIFSK